MVAFADNAETSFLSPATRARGQRSRIDRTSSYCTKLWEASDLEHHTDRERTHLGSCSRDPIGYVDGFNQYAISIGLTAVDPLGFACQPAAPEDPEEPKKPCGDKEVDPGVIPTIELCKTMFEIAGVPIKSPADLCKVCKKFKGSKNPLKELCEKACKKGGGKVKDWIIQEACCSGIPKIPAAPCLSAMLKDGFPPLPSKVDACIRCCSNLPELQGNFSAIDMCQKACVGNSGGR